MKFVYVLISSENDYYAEETLVSMFTLRKHNPGAFITLVSDTPTLDSLIGNRSRIKEYVDECIEKNSPAAFTPVQRSRFLKTSLRRIVEGDFLYLDNDTIISGCLGGIEDVGGEVAAVYNRHKDSWNREGLHFQLRDYYEAAGYIPEIDGKIRDYFNGGIIFCKDTRNAHRLYEAWHDMWMKSSTGYGFHKDQPDLWRANAMCGNIIEPLDGTYNCQLIYPHHCMEYMFNARILHYHSSAAFACHIAFKQPKVMEHIRNNGIDGTIIEYIDNLRSDYLKGMSILMDHEKEWYNSPFAIMSRKLSRCLPGLNKMAKAVYRIFGYEI